LNGTVRIDSTPGEGVELHFDAARYQPTVEQLMQLREAVRAALAPNTDSDPDDAT